MKPTLETVTARMEQQTAAAGDPSHVQKRIETVKDWIKKLRAGNAADKQEKIAKHQQTLKDLAVKLKEAKVAERLRQQKRSAKVKQGRAEIEKHGGRKGYSDHYVEQKSKGK